VKLAIAELRCGFDVAGSLHLGFRVNR
jgi:hypothetical protein